MVSKFTQKDIEKLENEQELAAYQWYQRNCHRLPNLTEKEEKEFLLGLKKCSPTLWGIFQEWERQKNYGRFPAIVEENSIGEFVAAAQALEQHFPGQGQNIGNDALIYKRFKTYTDLFVEAAWLFNDQYQRLRGFGGGSFEQLFSSIRLGLYNAVDNCVLSRAGLNYPDLRNDPSPRLQAVKKYLQKAYLLRVRFQVLDAYIRMDWFAKDIPGFVSQGQWSNFLADIKARLSQKFGKNSDKIFSKIFGSGNPPPPENQTQFNYYQEQILTWIAKIGVVSGNPDETPIDLEEVPNQDGFHRDYAQEQREREAREREARERQARENPDWGNINPQFKNNPDLVSAWVQRGFNYDQVKDWLSVGLKPKDYQLTEFLKKQGWTPEKLLNEGDMNQLKQEFAASQTQEEPEEESNDEEDDKNNNIDDKPKPEEQSKDKRDKSPSRQAAEDKLEGKETKPPVETGFNSSDLNDTLNSLSGALEEDTKETGNDKPYTPAPGLGMPISSITKEEAEKLPWLVMGMDTHPSWNVYDPANFAALSHGEGDWVTLLLKLQSLKIQRDFSNVLHNFFWAKNLGTEQNPIKGFQRLVKDNEPPSAERERERLLITGKQSDDQRARKLGWIGWPFGGGKRLRIGVPNVKQKSYRFTRMFRNQRHAYDLDNKDHFIGLLRDKKVISKGEGTSRSIGWGSAPRKSILWITNQLKYPRDDNSDWLGDDTQTINPNNGFAHYLIFTDFEICYDSLNKCQILKNPQNDWRLNLKGIKTLPQLIGLLNKHGKTVLVRLGPDTLELIDSQTPEQKGRSQDETPEDKKNTNNNVTPEMLKDLGLTPEEFEALKTAFLDPAHLANLIKKLAAADGKKLAAALDKMFDTINPKTAENMYNQMVDHNPVFSEQEKEELKTAYQAAKTKEEKKKLWEEITSNRAAEKAHAQKDKKQKDKIFEEQVNKNPRYGPPGVDTQERRDRFQEYAQADDSKKAKMQSEENERFTTGENANQWGNYFQDNANRECGAGDESVGTETDNNFNAQFSFTDSLAAINKLKNIGSMKPPGMEEGMKSNKPYWEVVFNHPLTYIFLFIGIIIAIMAAATRKNRS